jgi:hypothetical protein
VSVELSPSDRFCGGLFRAAAFLFPPPTETHCIAHRFRRRDACGKLAAARFTVLSI